MSEQEVIGILELQYKDAKDSYSSHGEHFANAITVAISALEKQIPKKPLNQKFTFYPMSTFIRSRYGECPICGTMQADDKYCQHCGQKLDWSVEE